jgi:hypothetical protein
MNVKEPGMMLCTEIFEPLFLFRIPHDATPYFTSLVRPTP